MNIEEKRLKLWEKQHVELTKLLKGEHTRQDVKELAHKHTEEIKRFNKKYSK